MWDVGVVEALVWQGPRAPSDRPGPLISGYSDTGKCVMLESLLSLLALSTSLFQSILSSGDNGVGQVVVAADIIVSVANTDLKRLVC